MVVKKYLNDITYDDYDKLLLFVIHFQTLRGFAY
jgi:hypothetical protein